MADLVELLAATTPLAGSGVYTSSPITLGQYVSLTVTCSADTDTTVDLQFSNDLTSGGGSPWITISKSFFAGVNDYESNPVLAKWVRLRVTNGSATPQSRLAVHVYGSPTNNSVSAKIEKIGNKSPEVDVSNLPLSGFGDLQTATMEPLTQYVFAGAGSATPTLTNVPLVSYYPSLVSKNLGNVVGSMKYSFPAGTGTIRLDAEQYFPPPGGIAWARIEGGHARYRAGVSLAARFTARWDSSIDLFDVIAGNYGHMIAGVSSAGTSYFAVGYSFEPGAASGTTRDFATQFGIVYDDNTGTRTFIPSGSWNGDKADGTGTLPAMNTAFLNIFEIRITYLGAASVEFRVLDVGTGDWVTIHTLRFANARAITLADEPSMGFLLEYYITGGVGFNPSGTLAVESGSCGILSAGSRALAYEEPHAVDTPTPITLVGSKETLILAVRNGDGALSNLIPAALDAFSFACEGTKPTVFRLYKNAAVAAPTWTTITGYTPMQVDRVGSLSAGRLVASFALGKSDNLFVSKHGNEFHLEPDEIFVITAKSTNASDVYASITFHLD